MGVSGHSALDGHRLSAIEVIDPVSQQTKQFGAVRKLWKLF